MESNLRHLAALGALRKRRSNGLAIALAPINVAGPLTTAIIGGELTWLASGAATPGVASKMSGYCGGAASAAAPQFLFGLGPITSSSVPPLTTSA